ncbi:MAG: 30S ribosomal protein S13 [Candidatus Aenigmarchaeota archaeon]|nr:30S ribosomal protein S13 [Candidatus Aenigmarchaeota archaeon]MDI6722209.1 30S ribosomal protein S13 [Candidatus Aenigmarchaeota archaeon]
METRKIVRIFSTDINGELGIERALRRVKGIGFMFSRDVCVALGIDGKRKVGTMSPDEVKRIESFIRQPTFPGWMLNRRKDIETGRDIHAVMAELDLKKREDINMLKKMRAYRGIRHEFGLPVRGQRTRSSFRTQKTVGVSKKRAQAQRAPPAQKK